MASIISPPCSKDQEIYIMQRLYQSVSGKAPDKNISEGAAKMKAYTWEAASNPSAPVKKENMF